MRNRYVSLTSASLLALVAAFGGPLVESKTHSTETMTKSKRVRENWTDNTRRQSKGERKRNKRFRWK